MLLLVDISKWNVFWDYDVLAARADGVFIKATDGRSGAVDKHHLFRSGFKVHWEETKKANLPRGAYHYWGPEADPIQQAQLFFNTVNTTGDLGEFPPVLDIEEPGDGANAKACILEIERLFQRTPIIYTRAGSFKTPFYRLEEPKKPKKPEKVKGNKNKQKSKKLKAKPKKILVEGLEGNLSWGKEYPLWVANYLFDDLDEDTPEKQLIPWTENLLERWVAPNLGALPEVPPTFKDTGRQIWQFVQIGDGKDWGQDPHNSKQIDLNIYQGTVEDLIMLGRQGDVPQDIGSQFAKSVTGSMSAGNGSPGKKSGTGKSSVVPADEPAEKPAAEPTYWEMTNQDILNLFNEAANSSDWWDWVVKAKLEGLAASPEVRQEKYTGPKFEDLPGLTVDQKQALLKSLPGVEPPTTSEPGFWVEVSVGKTSLKHFKSGKPGRDKKGKPIMISHRPPLAITRGTKVFVSDTHKESDLDKGNGTITATGGKEFYLILKAPANSRAVGAFIAKTDATPTTAPTEITSMETGSISGNDVQDKTPSEPGVWVQVKVNETTSRHFKSGAEGRDKKGKPIMVPHRSPVLLHSGDKVRVSTTHKESDLDKGDGVILASGRKEYYLIVESPDNPKAIDTFIARTDTRKV